MVPGTTAFEGVHQVKPGHVVKIKRRNGSLDISEHKYWDLDFPREKDRPEISEEDAIDEGIEGSDVDGWLGLQSLGRIQIADTATLIRQGLKELAKT